MCKGIAFVEMQNKAQAEAALKANGTSYRGKHLKVTISDPHHAEKNRGLVSPPCPANMNRKITDGSAAADRRSRTVYLFDIPSGSQEGLLQQELEKLFPVKRVELFASKGEARVELESQKDAGALLMRPEPFLFNGATVRIQDHPESKAAPSKPAAAMAASTSQPQAAPASALSFAPRPRKANKAMGGAYRPPRAATATAAPAPSGGSGQDAFRAFMNMTNESRKKADEERKAAAEAQREERAKLAQARREEAEKAKEEKDKKRALEDGEEGGEAKRAKRDDGEGEGEGEGKA